MTREPWEFRFELPGLPPSTNALYAPVSARGRRGARIIKSQRGRAWLTGAQLALQAAWRRAFGRRQPLSGLPVELRLWFGVERISSDTSNRIKALEDALTGIAWCDDCQVVELVARKAVVSSARVMGVVRIAGGVDVNTQRRIQRAKKARS